MRREERLKSMLKHHMGMVERLKHVDLNKLSERQLERLEHTLEELESYSIVHVRTKGGK